MSFDNDPGRHQEREWREVPKYSPDGIGLDVLHDLKSRVFQRVEVGNVVDDVVSIVHLLDQGSL